MKMSCLALVERIRNHTYYTIYQFRQIRQTPHETLDEFHACLKKQASLCKFHTEEEIRSQLILGCASNKLRRQALEDDDLSLQKILDKGRPQETSHRQTQAMEKPTQRAQIHAMQKAPIKTRQQYSKHNRPA